MKHNSFVVIGSLMASTIATMGAVFSDEFQETARLPASPFQNVEQNQFPRAPDSRSKSQAARVEKETMAESVARLSDINFYKFPESSGRVVQTDFLLDETFGADDIEAIVSNRRFQKALAGLNGAAIKQASALVNAELRTSLAQHVQMYERDVSRLSPHFSVKALAGATSIAGPSFVTGNVPVGETVIAGVRLKVLSLVWIAGMLQMTDCKQQVEEVTRTAVKQRMAIYGNAEVHPYFKQQMLSRASLYNRQLLASGLLGVSTEERRKAAIALLGEIKFHERNLASTRTEYLLPVRRGVSTPAYSGGDENVTFVVPLDDERFDEIYRLLTK